MKKYLLLLITIFSLNVVIGQTESYLKGIAKADTKPETCISDKIVFYAMVINTDIKNICDG